MFNCCYALEFNNAQMPLQTNALRVEIMSPQTRCLLKPPGHWCQAAKDKSSSWVLSGGDIFVFGYCFPKECVNKKEWEEI